jgi:flagellar biosynthesis chaperone FliJ
MVQIDPALKEKMKEQRLSQYQQQIFTLEMDIAALEAVGDEKGLEKAKKSLEDLHKAYAAVEAI